MVSITNAIATGFGADKREEGQWDMTSDESQDVADEEQVASAFDELMGGGLEHEVASIGGFTATMFLQVAKRQIALVKTLESLVPDFKQTFDQEFQDPSTLVQAASVVGGIIEECVDDDTPEDSMLLQVLDHCAALVESE